MKGDTEGFKLQTPKEGGLSGGIFDRFSVEGSGPVLPLTLFLTPEHTCECVCLCRDRGATALSPKGCVAVFTSNAE